MARTDLEDLARRLGAAVDDVVELWTERAAIREYEAGQTRAEAEAGALDDVRAYFTTSTPARVATPPCADTDDASSLVTEPRKGPRSVAIADAADRDDRAATRRPRNK